MEAAEKASWDQANIWFTNRKNSSQIIINGDILNLNFNLKYLFYGNAFLYKVKEPDDVKHRSSKHLWCPPLLILPY